MSQNHGPYIHKLVRLGWSKSKIAHRLGLTEQEVENQWAVYSGEAATVLNSGYADLIDQFTVLCDQYRLIGQSLSIISAGISNRVPTEEILKLSPEEIASKYIILQRFSVPDPEKLMEEHVTSKMSSTSN